MKELLNILSLLRQISPKASGNVIFQFLIGNRKSPLTTSFPTVVRYVVNGWRTNIDNLSPYFKLISNRLNALAEMETEYLQKINRGSYTNYENYSKAMDKKREEINLIKKEELSTLYITAWQDVKERYFDTTFFDELKNMNYEDLDEDKFKKLKEEVLATKTMLLKLH